MPDPQSTITPQGTPSVTIAVSDPEANAQQIAQPGVEGLESLAIPSPTFLFDMVKRNEVDWLQSFISSSDRTKRQYVDIWDEIWSNYLVSFGGSQPPFPSRNIIPIGSQPISHIYGSRLKDPETHQIVETLAAMGIGLIFGSRDYLQAVAVGIDDVEKARLLTRLLMAALEAPGVFRTLFSALKSSYIFGTSILELGWETRSRPQVIRKPIFDEFGRLIDRQFAIQDVKYKDGPLLREVDIYDFYPDFAGTRIQEDMAFVAKRFRITKHQALAMGQAGVYDLDAVKKAILLGEMMQKGASGGGLGLINAVAERPGQGDHVLPPKYGLLTGFEGYGEVPFREPDGHTNRVITTINGINVRSHINPFIDGHKPFKELVLNPIPGRFYGLGAAEVIRFLQDAADSLLMNVTDAIDLAVHAPIMIGNAFNGDPERIRRRAPLDVLEVGNVDAVKPIPVDTNVLTLGLNSLLQRKLTMREAGGAPNPTQGIASSGEQTATEISSLARFSTQRAEVMIQVIEREDLPWLGRAYLSRLRQFLPNEGAIAVLAGEQFKVRLDDIDFESDVRFMGSRQAVGKFQKAAGLREALNVLGTNPDIVLLYPELVTRYFRDALDIEDGEVQVRLAAQEFIKKQMVQLAMQAGAAGQLAGGGGPTSPAGSTEEELGTEAGATQREGEAIE